MKIGILSLIISLIVAYFSYYQFEKYQNTEANMNASFQTLQNNVKSEIKSEVKSDIEPLQKSIKKLEDNEATIQAMNNSEQMVLRTVEQYLQTAMLRLNYSSDVTSAMTLLMLSEDKLSKLHNSQLIPLREAIVKNLSLLKEVKVPDKEALWQSMSTLIESVNDLPIQGTTMKKDQNSSVTLQHEQSENWKEALLTSLKEIKDLVKIQHHDKPIEPILNDEEQTIIKERLRLLLEQIRWSILQNNANLNNTHLFQSIIKETNTYLDQYFQANDEKVKNLKLELEKLSQIELNPKLPDLSPMITMLHEENNSLNTSKESKESGGE